MIRLAKLSDIDQLLALLHVVLDVHYQIRPDLFIEGSTKYNKDELKAMIESKNPMIFVYEDNDEILAHLFCYEEKVAETNNQKEQKSLFIDDLCVKENAQHQGIGQKMFQYIKEYALQNNYQTITLNVFYDNQKAFLFYQKMGMTIKKCTYELKL